MTLEQAIDFKEIVNDRVRQEYVKAGFTKTARDGSTTVDDEKMRQRVFEVVSGAVITNKAEKKAKAISQGELFGLAFPDGPGARPGTADMLDPLGAEVRSVLTRKCWNLTNPRPTGYVQKRLNDTPLVLCRGEFLRDMDYIAGVWVTASPALIMEDSVKPASQKIVQVASDMRLHAIMVTKRHPELESKVVAEINSAFGRARAAGQLDGYLGNGRRLAELPPPKSDQDADEE